MSRKERRNRSSVSIPLYSDFIRLGSGLYNEELPLDTETVPDDLIEEQPFSDSPSYLEFIEYGVNEEYNAVTEEMLTYPGETVHQFLISHSPPSYSEFLLPADLHEMELDLGSETVPVPSYQEFLTEYTAEYLDFDTLVSEISEVQENELQTEEELLDEPKKSTKTKTEKAGLALAITGSALAWGSVVTAVVASRYVEWYMFVPAVLALILSIVGERMNRRSKHQFYVNTVVFSVFAGIFPLILLAVGWLAL